MGRTNTSNSPEKDHAAQLRSLAALFETHPEYRSGNEEVKLVLVGSSRNAEDAARIDNLENLARELGIQASALCVWLGMDSLM